MGACLPGHLGLTALQQGWRDDNGKLGSSATAAFRRRLSNPLAAAFGDRGWAALAIGGARPDWRIVAHN
ncbi:hypothetical protein PG996_013923 [Apiospora saccharicola]|uniref:Uncharacterized protein n=1 Tax=Apiospora saccharicola TaxID=335842 RepID=A0ABR1TJF0_9PEZI